MRLVLNLRALAAKEFNGRPEIVQARQADRDLRNQMRGVCELYLAGELSMRVLVERLRAIERTRRAP
jgi:hypothetical protein